MTPNAAGPRRRNAGLSSGFPYRRPPTRPPARGGPGPPALSRERCAKRGADGTRFKVQLDFIPGTAEGVAVAEYIREQGKKIGVDIQLRNSPDFPTWAGRMGQWEYELSLDAVFNYPDPVIGVERTYISTNIKKSVWANTMGYANPKVDDLFQKAQREQNFDRRKALYGQVQDVLTTDLPLIWINEIGYTTVWNKEFDAFPINVWGTMSPFLDVRWTKAT
jgi:peptide/nickel transport system substrate-binding protein